MAPEVSTTRNAPVLPVYVVGLVDLGRLTRELERLEDAMRSEHLRTSDEEDTLELPKLSNLLQEVADINHIDLRSRHNRESLLEFFKLLRKEAPKVHISFSADPNPEFMHKLMSWLRTNIHPHLMVAVGLQPGIGAGCVLRTTNRYFDMSLSKRFAGSRQLLVERLKQPLPGEQRNLPEGIDTTAMMASQEVTS